MDPEADWFLEPHLVFRDQMVAFMMSSHARCGAGSAASALTSHNAPLARWLVGKWSRGRVVTRMMHRDHTSVQLSSVVGVSRLTLGVTSSLQEWKTQGGVERMDSTHCMCVGFGQDRPFLVDLETGRCLGLPGTFQTSMWLHIIARGRWVVLSKPWTVWKVTMGDGDCDGDEDCGTMSVSQPRRLVPWWKMMNDGTGCRGTAGVIIDERKENEEGDDGFHFTGMVGDGFFEVWSRVQSGIELNLVDVERAFETGLMVPVDTASVPLMTYSFHFFWASKRALVVKEHMAQLLLESRHWKLLCSCQSHFDLEDFLITYRNELINQCEVWYLSSHTSQSEMEPKVITLPCLDCQQMELNSWGGLLVLLDKVTTKVHVVDPTSGVHIFTVSATERPCNFSEQTVPVPEVEEEGAALSALALIDVASVFESGLMVAVETVKVPVPLELQVLPSRFWFFWDTKRFVFEGKEEVCELLRDGTTRLLFRKPTVNHTVVSNFVVALTKGVQFQLLVWNFSTTVASEPITVRLPSGQDFHPLYMAGDFLAIEATGNQILLVDPSSGAVIFTLIVPPNIGLYLANNGSFQDTL
ncbi:hypothetical protein Pelo_14799 [Pelomyxa schiedti]|nr:hypothetical protein Pelo_14799 [Pelomyxa schiedti]